MQGRASKKDLGLELGLALEKSIKIRSQANSNEIPTAGMYVFKNPVYNFIFIFCFAYVFLNIRNTCQLNSRSGNLSKNRRQSR